MGRKQETDMTSFQGEKAIKQKKMRGIKLKEREKKGKSGLRKDRSNTLNFKEERAYHFELEQR